MNNSWKAEQTILKGKNLSNKEYGYGMAVGSWCHPPIKQMQLLKTATPLQQRPTVRKSMKCMQNYGSSNRHLSTEEAPSFRTTTPHISKIVRIGDWSCALPEPRIFTNHEQTKTAFVDFIKFWTSDFYVDGINWHIWRWQKCAASNGAYFDYIERVLRKVWYFEVIL